MKKNIVNSFIVMVIVVCCFAFLWGCLFVVKETLYSEEKIKKQPSGDSTIPINGMVSFNTYIRPRVQFAHDKHIEVLHDKGCTVCHPRDKNDKDNIIYTFPKKMDDTNRTTVMDSYHAACMDCHDKMKVGTSACGECHIRR